MIEFLSGTHQAATQALSATGSDCFWPNTESDLLGYPRLFAFLTLPGTRANMMRAFLPRVFNASRCHVRGCAASPVSLDQQQQTFIDIARDHGAQALIGKFPVSKRFDRCLAGLEVDPTTR